MRRALAVFTLAALCALSRPARAQWLSVVDVRIDTAVGQLALADSIFSGTGHPKSDTTNSGDIHLTATGRSLGFVHPTTALADMAIHVHPKGMLGFTLAFGIGGFLADEQPTNPLIASLLSNQGFIMHVGVGPALRVPLSPRVALTLGALVGLRHLEVSMIGFDDVTSTSCSGSTSYRGNSWGSSGSYSTGCTDSVGPPVASINQLFVQPRLAIDTSIPLPSQPGFSLTISVFAEGEAWPESAALAGLAIGLTAQPHRFTAPTHEE